MTEPKPDRVKSPCISICALNEDDVCAGCWRSADEISHWARYKSDERREVLKRCFERAKKNNPFM